jgi:hypothetical protein
LITDGTRQFGSVDIVHLKAGVMTRPKTALGLTGSVELTVAPWR